MALAKRYTFGFYDRFNRHVICEIWHEGYSGLAEAIPVIGKPPVVINRGRPSNFIFDPIKGSSAEVLVHKSTILQYQDFFSSDFRNSRVDVYIDSVLFWRGWGLPDVYSESLSTKTVALNFVDGLSLLSDINFELTGEKTLFEIVTHILDQIGLGIGLKSGVSVREDSISTTTSVEPLDQITYNAGNFNGLSCRDVLAQILEKQGLRIYQEEGFWIIEQVGDKPHGETIRTYNSSWVYQSVATVDRLVVPANVISAQTTWFRAGNAVIEMVPGWKEFENKDDFGLEESIIDNGTFEKYVESGGTPFPAAKFDNWTNNPGTKLLIFDNKPYLVLESIVGTTYLDYGLNDFTIHEAKPLFAIADATQLMAVKFKWALFTIVDYQPTEDPVYAVYFHVRIKCGSYYLHETDGWILTETSIALNDTIRNRPIRRGLYFHDFEIYPETIPLGTLEVSIFRPLNTNPVAVYGAITDFQVTLFEDTGAYYDAEQKATIFLNENNNYKGESKTWQLTDVPDVGNNTIVYRNAMTVNALATNNWKWNGLEGTLSELYAYQLLQNYHTLKAKLTGVAFLTNVAGFGSVLKMSGLSERRFIFTKFRHDLYRSVIDSGEMLELPFYPYFASSGAVFFAQMGTNVVNARGANATVEGNYIIFPEVANDIFDRSDATFWASDIPIHESDPRKWLISELTGTFTIQYSTATTRARLFFRDYSGTASSILPIVAYTTDRTEAQQQEIVDWLNEYFFLLDEDGNVLIDDEGDYLITD